MERISRFRSRVLLGIFIGVVIFLALKLYDLQIIETEGGTLVDNTTTFTTLTRVKASRGDLLDRNGNVLVGNRASYDLILNHYVVLSTDGTNDHLYKLVKLCQELGIEYNDSFPVSKERPFTYTLEEQNSTRQSYFHSFLEYSGGLDSDISPSLLLEKLREKYNLPTEWTDEEARLVIGLRYELSLRYCVSTMSNYVFLSDASDEALSAITELNIPGMNVEATTVREYNTHYAAHILGYVGAMSAEQWEYYKTIDGYEMDAEIGQSGLEAVYEEYLHGVDGWREDTVTADGTLVSSVYLQEPKAGSNVEVSIDLQLQEAAERSLAEKITNLRNQEDEDADGRDAEGGAVVAMDVKTGQVLVCASYPTYDLTTFFDDYNTLVEADYNPLFNRALMGTYPPGSVYKMVTSIAAVDSGKVGVEEIIYDAGEFTKYEGFTVSCLAFRSGYSHGDLNLANALKVSCNYYFFELGDRLDIDVMDNVAKHMGLGEATGVELPEATGYRANPETKAMLYPSEPSWYLGDQITAAIGQGENRFTPMQLCVYATTLANKGTRYKATFMNRVVSADYQSLLDENLPTIVDKLEISADATYAYVEGMKRVTGWNGGTADDEFLDFPIDVAGKTGTAEEVWGASENGSFICFAPADDPQIAIAVYIERGGHGNVVSTIARDILEVYFDVDEVSDVTTTENRVS